MKKYFGKYLEMVRINADQVSTDESNKQLWWKNKNNQEKLLKWVNNNFEQTLDLISDGDQEIWNKQHTATDHDNALMLLHLLDLNEIEDLINNSLDNNEMEI